MEKIKTLVKSALFILEKILFELKCPLCQKEMRSCYDDPLCQECIRCLMSIQTDPGCRLCGNLISHEQILCGSCSFSPPPVQGFWAYGCYDEDLKELIKAYKYGEITRLATILVALLSDGYRRMPKPAKFDAVVIVPKFRARWQKVYPMKKVARKFCKIHQIRFIPDTVIKKRNTPAQATLTGKARIKNLKGAFAVRPGINIKGLDLLLLDDVSTTGSTVRYVANVLSQAGAQVWVLVIAKAR